MEQKRFSPLKLVAAIVFILLAVFTGIRCVTLLAGTIAAFSGQNFGVVQLLSNLCSTALMFVSALTSLLIGIACFLKNTRKLALGGAIVLLLVAVLSYLLSWVVDIVFIFQYGIDYARLNILNIWFVCSQISSLLSILVYVAFALVLLLDRKANKIMRLVPAVLRILVPVWFVTYSFFQAIFNGWFSFSWLFSMIVGAGLLLALFEAVGFAALCLALESKEESASREVTEVIEETEELPVVEEVPEV